MENCPYCGNPGRYYIRIFEEDHYKCRHCGLIFLFPYPKQSDMISRHLNDQYVNHPYFQAGEEILKEGGLGFYHVLIAKLKLFLHKNSRVLDVGAGTGDFLSLAAKHFQLSCIEPSHKLVEKIQQKVGCPVFVSSLEDYTTEQPFDAIVMLDVIEHTADPRLVLEKVRSLLKPGGILIVSTLDSRSILYLLAPLIWRFSQLSSKAQYLLQRIFCYQHNWYFNRAVLRDLMVEMKYDVIEHHGYEFPLNRLRESRIILWGLRVLYLMNTLLRMKTEQYIIVRKYDG